MPSDYPRTPYQGFFCLRYLVRLLVFHGAIKWQFSWTPIISSPSTMILTLPGAFSDDNTSFHGSRDTIYPCENPQTISDTLLFEDDDLMQSDNGGYQIASEIRNSLVSCESGPDDNGAAGQLMSDGTGTSVPTFKFKGRSENDGQPLSDGTDASVPAFKFKRRLESDAQPIDMSDGTVPTFEFKRGSENHGPGPMHKVRSAGLLLPYLPLSFCRFRQCRTSAAMRKWTSQCHYVRSCMQKKEL